ncbi:spatacsin isoform X1 [Colletes latitarsis]|uniref:spatacsin isoform X1 n=1 Tax=Colletes latitarsis TaxID=2605962 RepID=UPI00403523D2
MAERTMVGGIPLEYLTGEPAVIWSGWRSLGDRELVREASAKGTHIPLAYKCLAYRRNCSINDAQHYFNKEVEIWITELLNKHQIFRASHVLQNMERNPVEYIFQVCMNCKESMLRNYLSEYLISIARFENEHIDSWNILKNIIQYEQKYMINDGLSSSVRITDIVKLPENIKQALCTELYFSITEQNLLKNITNIVLWDYLLSTNEIEMIKFWIDIYYNENAIRESNDIYEKYKFLFTTMDIIPDMIDAIDSSNASNLVKDLIKNHLCRYGIFVQREKQDIKLILARIFGSAITLSEFNTILLHKTCNINKTDFFQIIDKELCLAHCLTEEHTQEDEFRLLELFDILKQMCESQEHVEDILIEGIFKTINYLSDDINEFLKQNYLVVLVLIFSYLSKENIANNKNENILKSIFTSEDDLQLGAYSISNEVLQNTLRHVPILQNIIENKPKKEVTIYQLLDGYKNLNVKQLFKWRLNNEEMPHFSDETLIKKYGHTEALTYEYYLKEARPNMAILSLKHSQRKLVKSVSSRRKRKAGFYAHILALRNLDKPEILCSCVSFIEMLDINSDILKLHITAANYVQKETNVPIGHLLENVIYKDVNDIKTLMSYLENSFQKNLNEHLIEDSKQFINVLKTWDVIVRFAKIHNYFLPTSLLKFLAKQNHWFEFILVCQIFSYPLDQVLKNTKHFEDAIIRDHLLTCLNNTQFLKSQSVIHGDQKIKSRDVRQSLYYKIGVNQSEFPTSGSHTSTDSGSIDSCSIYEYPINDSICSLNDDLWLIILKCHQSPDPPGALINASQLTSRPFLAVLATCYEPSAIAAYAYSWMVISASDKNITSDYKECLEQQIWTANQVLNLLDRMVICGYIGILNKAYKIFMPECPFNSFFEFLTQCTNYGDFKDSQKNLLEFNTQCLNLKRNKVMDWDCSDNTYMENLYWVAIVAIKCIIATLAYGLRSTHSQIKFLETLITCNFYEDFPVYVPNFQHLLQIIKILQETTVTLNFTAITMSNNVYNFDLEIQRCIDDLLKVKNYNSALELSNVAGLNSSDIILAQYRNQFKYYMQQNDKIKNEFWNECALNFKKYNVSCEKTVEFFIEHAEKVISHKERYEILHLVFEILKNVETEQEIINKIEVAMWKSCILAGPENVQLNSGPYIFNKLKTELLSELNTVKFSCTLNYSYEKNAAENLINKLIDLGKLDIALRIRTIFNYKHKDLQILMLCLSLAEGEIIPSELASEEKILLKEVNDSKQPMYGAFKNRGLQRFSSSTSLITSNNINETYKMKDENVHKVQMECLSILQKLHKTLKHGADICLRIVLCYKLAVQLGKSYHFLLMLNDPFQFLQEIAESNVDNKCEILNDIIIAYKVNNDSVATFLTENITINVTLAIEGGYDNNISLWGYSLNTNFRIIMELCNDISLLGWQLLKTANNLLGQSHGENKTVSTLKTIVELLIRSHDCFTTSCNMEGIASILRKCQNLANVLQNHKLWALLVRLVTGVGRFTEMNYIFHILKNNDQFEYLLGQGLDKVMGLKMALLEFLKHHCPENRDLFTLVALHFQLYHEMAFMWENEAKDVLKTLISDAIKVPGKLHFTTQRETKFYKSENVQKQLQLAINNFTHATQYYLQANELNLAGQCSDQTQLVGLQLSLLNTVSNNQQVISILNLKSEDVERILCHTLNFSQALIVIQAYNHHVDWACLIYNHCILSGQTKYLKDFLAVKKLTPSLVEDCARRYRLEKNITHTMMDNMKTLVSELSDVECKYMLASQLGFKNIIETMLNDPMIGAYLKDTVWKKGYNTN